jgi:D-beta-D-heptose 7-phosphate kinase/D-beta-D-heptose 1-phosphate adenosyltransferase
MAPDAMVPEAIAAAIEERRGRGDRVVFTNGCFDLLHPGHVKGLRAARALGDMLVVGLNSDASVRALKGPSRPVLPAAARAELLTELRCVDHVVIFHGASPLELLAQVRPDVYVKGADWKNRPLPEADLVRKQGGEVAFLDLVSGYSTTAIIESIRAVTLDGEDEAPDAH